MCPLANPRNFDKNTKLKNNLYWTTGARYKVKNAVNKTEHNVKMLDEKVQCQTKQIHEYKNSIEVIIDLYKNINFDQNDTESKIDHLQGLMKKWK
jgi:chromosome segregation ATPase